MLHSLDSKLFIFLTLIILFKTATSRALDDVVLGIEDTLVVKDFYQIRCFPNPAHQASHFTYNLKEIPDVKICLYDLMGKKIYEKTILRQLPGEHKFDFNISSFHQRLLMGQIHINHNIYSEKIFLSH